MGAAQGLIVTAFNYLAHRAGDNDDIIIKNKEGDELGRIVTDKIDKTITLDTDVKLPSSIRIEIPSDADAVGLNLELSYTFRGGMYGGVSVVYFLSGDNKGSAYLYRYKGGNVGLEGGVGGGGFYSNYVDSNKLNFNANGFAGQSSGYSGGVWILGGSYSWANRNNIPELYPGHKSLTTWKSYSSGLSKGLTNFKVGGKVFWSQALLWKKLF